jgi:hypothetical protein
MEWLEQPVLPEAATDTVFIGASPLPAAADTAESATVVRNGETFVGIRNVDAMPPFLMSVVSNGNLWLFVGSNSPFTAGRGDADHAIFPYRTADKILRHPGASGARSLFLVERDHGYSLWEPWQSAPGTYRTRRNLFKSEFGTSVIFEEINDDLGLSFAWTLTTSEAFGLVRFCTLENLRPDTVRVRYLDGWNQILPAGIGQDLFDKFSYLAAAYMRHENQCGLGIFTLNSGITDRAEPCESLRAAAAWSLGHPASTVLLCARQVEQFRRGQPVKNESEVRGEFGAHFICGTTQIKSGAGHEWISVADTGLDHCALTKLKMQLASPAALRKAVEADVVATREGLKRRIAAADGLQQTADTTASVHHFANVLFNCMRGGTLPDGYRFPKSDFASFLQLRNATIAARHEARLEALPAQLDLATLRQHAQATGDRQFIRLAREYLPLTFSRRHGDPSRPWNRFSIRTRDELGGIIYDYEGNWRDIFQNWESLAQSYPACLESMVAIFLNASTADGYNPYRITRSGIDWEVEDPHDPWSHIGYWGDHQIIYLMRLLESYEQFEPGKLASGLSEISCAYACVPYEIRSFVELARDPRQSIHFNDDRHQQLLTRAKEIGNDGKLLTGKDGEVLLVSLAEKLLVPLLAKLSNLVPGGGIWLNTQRPEWNDANNALAGWGLSVVTVAHLRRYLIFLDRIFAVAGDPVHLSTSVADFADGLASILARADGADDAARFEILSSLGQVGEKHRQAVYQGALGVQTTVLVSEIRRLLAAAGRAVDATLHANRRADGLFHSYNLLRISGTKAAVGHLNLMLEGQVAVLGSGLLTPEEAQSMLHALRHSALFREDQHSYLLYPDREIAPFLSRNTLPQGWQKKVPNLAALVSGGWREIIAVDESGGAHFHGDLSNVASLEARLDRLGDEGRWQHAIGQDRAALLELWETVFQHSAFTGRSGSMFAFEGLGSIYWHMIAKLLLAVAESHRHAVANGAAPEILAGLLASYHDIRRGLGFMKSPAVYGAFPTDPYSHTPRHLGAQQPGMTGQVKEEILTRREELGVRVVNGILAFEPKLLKLSEFLSAAHDFTYMDPCGTEQVWSLPADSLAFTCCQVPVCYRLADAPAITILEASGVTRTMAGHSLSPADSSGIFSRSGRIARIIIDLPGSGLSK